MNHALRVLVVDDDRDVANGTARVLEQAGYAVDREFTGEDGWQSAQDHVPDLVLLDRDLPGIDGLEVCRRIKAAPALSATLVILASASYATSDDQAGGLEAGADGYIARPIANRELLARVAAYGRIQALSSELQRQTDALRAVAESSAQAQMATLNLLEDAIESRHRSEAAVEAERTADVRYRRLFDNAPFGIFRFTPDGKFLSVNAALATMLGYASPHEAIETVSDIAAQHYADPAEHGVEIDAAAGVDRYVTQTRTFRRRDGTTWIGSTRTRIALDALGKTDYYEGFVEDITEHTKATVAIAQQLDELTRWHGVMLDREDRVQELKREVNDLLRRLGEPVRYPSQQKGAGHGEQEAP